MVDNFDLLKSRLTLLGPGDFFPVIVLKRKKDNPEMNKQCQVLYRSKICNTEEYEAERIKLIDICKKNNARAYIKVNRRNEKDVSEAMVRYVLDKHLNQEYDKMQYAYDHIVGVTGVKKDKYYMIDIDINEQSFEQSFGGFKLKDLYEKPSECQNDMYEEILNYFKKIRDAKRMAEGEIIRVQTKNGFHVLAPAFSIEMFHELSRVGYVIYDIKQDAETVLYIP